MDKKTIFVKTAKGENESSYLSGDLKRVMLLIDNESTLDEVTKRAPPSLRAGLKDILEDLLEQEYIRDSSKSTAAPKIAMPKMFVPKTAVAAAMVEEELDFTNTNPPTAAKQAMIAEQQKEAQAMRARAELEAAVVAAKAKSEAEAREKAEAKARQDAALAARTRAEAELTGKQEEAAAQEAARLQAAEAAKRQAEQEAARIRAEAEAARIKAEQEAARVRAEAERIRAEAEAARIRAEQEAARIKAEQEAARIRAEQEAARIRAEQEAARIRAEAEAERARAEREAARIKAEAEAVRAKAEQEAARARAEQETARARAEQAAQTTPSAATPFEIKLDGFMAASTPAEMPVSAAPAPAPAASSSLFEIKLDGFMAGAAAPVIEEPVQAPKEPVASPPVERKEPVVEAKPQRDMAAEMARMKAEADAARKKAEEDARRQQEEQALAAEQAKAWEEAEQRAAVQAKIEAEQAVQQAALAQARAEQQKIVRVHRKPLPLGKMLFGLIFLALAGVLVLPYVMPLAEYVAPLERQLSAQLDQPVHVTGMSAATFPPQLVLTGVTLGDQKELKVSQATLFFDPLTLFSAAKEIKNMELQGVAVEGDQLERQMKRLKGLGGNALYPVKHVTFRDVAIVSREVSLPKLAGIADIGVGGTFTRVALHSEDNKLALDIQPAQSGWTLAVNLRDSSLPFMPGLVFNEFSAKGAVGEGEINFSEVDAHIYNGILVGAGKIEWARNWILSGRLEAKSFELNRMFPGFGVEGELYGDGTYSMSADAFSKLGEAPRLDASFTLKRGVINGIDMVETARLSAHDLVGGRTHFDDMIGQVQLLNGASHFRGVKIVSGMLSANGSFDVAINSQLSGSFGAVIKMRAGNNPLTLYGTAREPKVRAGR